MVSFSCDECQNVFTKPKIERHIQHCRTRTVSCIDCLNVFDVRTVRAHSSCITEADKYGPKSQKTDACTQTYCGICSLRLNGAVHAVQHYDSRKHRSGERKMKEEQKRKGKDGNKRDEKQKNMEVDAKKNGKEVDEEEGKELNVKIEKEVDGKMAKQVKGKRDVELNGRKVNDTSGMKDRELSEVKKDIMILQKHKEKQDEVNRAGVQKVYKVKKRSTSIKKAMKKILEKAPKNKLRRNRLLDSLAILLGQDAPDNLGELVDKRATRSSKFKVKKGRITLLPQ